jgi:5-methylcytosine-specific restriction endonuclease McrA
MRALDTQATTTRHITWQVAHETLSRLARQRAAADAEEGRWLLAAQRAAVHVHLGFGSFSEYVGRLFGYQPRSLQEKLRVAEALEGLPAVALALSSGELSWSAVRELTRVALPETEGEWLDFARGKTLRQLEQVLAGKEPGAVPGSPSNPSVQRHVLRFDVAAETLALFRDALNELRRRAGGPLDDDSALLELARAVLGGPRDEGRASYQIVIDVCSACGAGRQQASGGLVPVGPDVLRMAHCDAQHIAVLTGPSPPPANDFEPHRDRAERDAHVTQSSSAHVGVSGQRPTATVRPRARQAIPPARRRAVLLRDQRCCQVPGCTNSHWLDVHHLELRSEGGANSLENLACLCSAHHRAAHRGEILIERSACGALRVRHADGSAYGQSVNPRALELRAKVFSALRHLGFREGDARAALQSLQTEPANEPASFSELLREALTRLRRQGGRR